MARITTREMLKVYLDELKDQADAKAGNLGHRLQWRPIRFGIGGGGSFRRGQCTLCGLTVKISRESGIEGGAVTAACEGGRPGR